MFVQRFLVSPRGKHCNSRERNVRRKVVSRTKKTTLEINAFSPQFYHKWRKRMLIRGKNKFLSAVPRNVF